MSKINNKKQERQQVTEVTLLDSEGVGTRRFRKSDELFYLLKQIKM